MEKFKGAFSVDEGDSVHRVTFVSFTEHQTRFLFDVSSLYYLLVQRPNKVLRVSLCIEFLQLSWFSGCCYTLQDSGGGQNEGAKN